MSKTGVGKGSAPLLRMVELPEAFEKEILVQASPLVRKIILNPKVYLWFDYARSELKFQGDIGDFFDMATKDVLAIHGIIPTVLSLSGRKLSVDIPPQLTGYG